MDDTGGPIGPADFETRARALVRPFADGATTREAVVRLMADTLESLGYGAGLAVLVEAMEKARRR